jgi:hypothetical protein
MAALETVMPTVLTPISTGQQFRDRYRPTVPDMVDDAYAGTGLVCAISGTNITVGLGGAVVQGGRYDLVTTGLTIASAAAGAANIFNSIVLTYDITHTPPIYARNIAGTSGGGLASVPYTNSLTGVWDFPLCHYERQPGGTLVNLRDRRKFSDGYGNTLSADDANGTSGIGWFPLSPRVGQMQKFWPSGDLYRWDGAAWVLIVRGTVPAPAQATSTTDITSIITTYAVSSTVVSATLVAPASGAMFISVGARGHHASVGESAYVAFEVRLTSSGGAVQLAAADVRSITLTVANDTSGFYRYLMTGLTPGSTYYVQLLQRSSTTGTSTFINRSLLLEPSP